MLHPIAFETGRFHGSHLHLSHLAADRPAHQRADLQVHRRRGQHRLQQPAPEGVQAQPVDLPPLNSVVPQAPVSPAPSAGSNSREPPRNAYEILELAGLPTEEALRANNGTFTVNVLIKPRLQPPHLLRLLLDDEPYGQPSNVPSLQLVNVDRGEHRLAVQVIDGQTVIQQSPAVALSVQRVHKP